MFFEVTIGEKIKLTKGASNIKRIIENMIDISLNLATDESIDDNSIKILKCKEYNLLLWF